MPWPRCSPSPVAHSAAHRGRADDEAPDPGLFSLRNRQIRDAGIDTTSGQAYLPSTGVGAPLDQSECSLCVSSIDSISQKNHERNLELYDIDAHSNSLRFLIRHFIIAWY